MFFLSILIAAGLLVQPTHFATDDIWPQWRGPTRDGQVADAEWPGSLTDSLSKVWEMKKLGPSYSGPIITPKLIITTATENEEREVVTAFDRETGERVWETEWIGSMTVPFFAKKNGSWIRSTPAYDGHSIFVAGMNDVIVSLDAEDGSEQWRVDFVERYDTPRPDFGFVCSPLVVDDAIYVQAGASFCKLNKLTGETIWRSLIDDGGMHGSAFSSPIMADINGSQQLVVLSRTTMFGVDPETGNELWSSPIRAFRGMNILTPIEFEDSIFTATYGGRAQLLDLSRNENDAGFSVDSRWDNRVQGYMTSPVIIDGHVYFFTRGNRFACLRLEDGQEMWISPPTGDDYWSLTTDGKHILALTNTGSLKLIAADTAEFRAIDEFKVTDEPAWAHLAIVNNDIYIRSQDGLTRWNWSTSAVPETD